MAEDLTASDLQILGRSPFVVFRIVISPRGKIGPEDLTRFHKILMQRSDQGLVMPALRRIESHFEETLVELSSPACDNARDLAAIEDILNSKFVISEAIPAVILLANIAMDLVALPKGFFGNKRRISTTGAASIDVILKGLGCDPRLVLMSNNQLNGYVPFADGMPEEGWRRGVQIVKDR